MAIDDRAHSTQYHGGIQQTVVPVHFWYGYFIPNYTNKQTDHQHHCCNQDVFSQPF